MFNPFENKLNPNLVMYRQRSGIEQVVEQQNQLSTLKEHVRNFVSQYDTQNIVFGVVGTQPVELTEGFLSIRLVTSDLEDALKNLQIGESIQIHGLEKENREYRIGMVYRTITECKYDKLVNITDFNEIEK